MNSESATRLTDLNGVDLVKKDTQEEVEKEYFCGIGRFRPKCLQIFRDAKFFTFILCSFCFIEGAAASGFFPVVLSSIEVRYQLAATEVGAIASTFDVAVAVSVIFISYFAGYGHKPRLLGISLLTMGLGALIFALPQFVFGKYQPGAGGESFESCLGDVDFTPFCGEATGKNSAALPFFFIGALIMGFGAAPLFTVGPAFIDEITHPKYVPLHLGAFFVLSILGPALGFGLGGAFLTVFVDPGEEGQLIEADPSFVGAWWLCFIFTMAMSWIIAIPFLLFPKKLPNHKEIQAEREKEMVKKPKKASPEGAGIKYAIKALPRLFCQVITTLSFLFISLAITVKFFYVSGFVAFGPKYYEAQFSFPPSTSSLVVGAIGIPTGVIGAIIGSLILFLTKSKGRKMVVILLTITCITMPFLLGFLLHCPTAKLAGVVQPYADNYQIMVNNSDVLISPNCAMTCNCNSSVYEPVCGADQVTYFSPCRAGCLKNTNGNDSMVSFKECTCIAANLMQQQQRNSSLIELSVEDFLPMSTATVGECDQNCIMFAPQLAVAIIGLILVFALEVPYLLVTIRSVTDEQRTLALGIQSFLYRALGTVPGPIAFGAIFDTVCLLFRFECGGVGNCWLYDNPVLAYALTGLSICALFLSIIFQSLALFTFPKKSPKEEEKAITAEATNEIVLENTDGIIIFENTINGKSSNTETEADNLTENA